MDELESDEQEREQLESLGIGAALNAATQDEKVKALGSFAVIARGGEYSHLARANEEGDEALRPSGIAASATVIGWYTLVDGRLHRVGEPEYDEVD